MSILRPVIRACAVAALMDQTWAGPRVYDSDNTPLAQAVLGQPAQPYICVYTDTDDLPGVINRELYSGGTRQLTVSMEIGVASAIRGDNGQIIIQFASTDQGMEWAVDIIEGQALGALIGNPQSEWGELFKDLILEIASKPSSRGGQATTGIRYAARRTSLTVSTIFEPVPGRVLKPDHPIMRFIKMADALDPSGNLAPIIDLGTLVNNLLTTEEASTWELAQAYLGLSKRQVRAIVPPGTPAPWPHVEVPLPNNADPAYDWSDKNPFVPPLDTLVLGEKVVSTQVDDPNPDTPEEYRDVE